jgi:hypothetical protein
LLAQRDAFRRERNYREADRIRDRLAERGIVIEDVAGGARWRRSAAPTSSRPSADSPATDEGRR